jgi:dihydropteroate synthase
MGDVPEETAVAAVSRLRFAGLTLDCPRVMGVVNVTSDSFSDAGETASVQAAVARAYDMLAAGADIIDVGGESTRPGAEPVDCEVEIARVVPVIRALAAGGALVSIDTRRAQVMQAAIAAGARIVNDVSALADPDALPLIRDNGAAVVLMHMQGEPRTMQLSPRYQDVVLEVRDWLQARVAFCRSSGITPERIAVDPGIGFGKTTQHNLDLLANLHALVALGCAVLIGVSRKSFIARIAGQVAPRQRLPGSLAAALAAISRGVHILRVHDVAETRQAIAIWQAINSFERNLRGDTLI